MTIREKLFEIQKEVSVIKKGQVNPFFNSKYFDVNTLLATLKPVLNKHRLVLIQPLTNENGRPAISTRLLDLDSTERITASITLPDLQDPQKMGSAITYYRRYALQSLFALEAEDDDANLASGKKVAEEKPSMVEKEFRKIEENMDRDPFTTHKPLDIPKSCPDCGADMTNTNGFNKQKGKAWSRWNCTVNPKHQLIWG